MATIRRLDLHDDFMSRGFTTFKHRHPGRYDLEIARFSSDEFGFLHAGARWLPLVKAILGASVTWHMLSLSLKGRPMHASFCGAAEWGV